MARTSPTHALYKLRLAPSRGLELAEAEQALDESRGLIRGFSVMEQGEIRGHDMEADRTTLEEVVRLSNHAVEAAAVADRKVRGIKMRKGHPSVSFDALGTTMAAARDFRIGSDGRVRADSQFLEAAPAEDRRHIFALARERPDFFGTSLVVSGKAEKRLDEEGNPAKGEDGKALLPFFRPSAVHAVDFVDKGAATASGFFGGTSALLSAEAAEQLDNILTREDFAERVKLFLSAYELDHPGAADKIRAALTGDAPMAEPETPTTGEESPPAGAITNEAAIEHLRAAGFQVRAPAKPEPAPAKPEDAGVLAELKALRADLDAERKARADAEEKAEKAARESAAAALKARVEKLTHLGADDRKAVIEDAQSLLEAGNAAGAERLITRYERIPDPLSEALSSASVSVPIAGEGARTVDLSRYARLVEVAEGDGEGGVEMRAMLTGDREYMAAAALASEEEKPDVRRKARIDAFAAARGLPRGGAA